MRDISHFQAAGRNRNRFHYEVVLVAIKAPVQPRSCELSRAISPFFSYFTHFPFPERPLPIMHAHLAANPFLRPSLTTGVIIGPLNQLPLRSTRPYDEPMPINLPVGIHGSRGSRRPAMASRMSGANGVVSGAPDARGKVPPICVRMAKPVPNFKGWSARSGELTFFSSLVPASSVLFPCSDCVLFPLNDAWRSVCKPPRAKTRKKKGPEKKKAKTYFRNPPQATASA